MAKLNPLQPCNHRAYQFLRKTQQAVIKCNQMGLAIIGMNMSGFATIEVQDSPETRKLIRDGKAIIYGRGLDHEHYKLAQMTIDGVRIKWRTTYFN